MAWGVPVAYGRNRDAWWEPPKPSGRTGGRRLSWSHDDNEYNDPDEAYNRRDSDGSHADYDSSARNRGHQGYPSDRTGGREWYRGDQVAHSGPTQRYGAYVQQAYRGTAQSYAASSYERRDDRPYAMHDTTSDSSHSGGWLMVDAASNTAANRESRESRPVPT